jgi:hypothetical protein
MPKLELMAQISRPFQIALVALLALAMLMVTWFMLLHRSNGTASSGTSSPSVAASAGSSPSHAATRASSSISATGSPSAAGSRRVATTGSASMRHGAAVRTHHTAVVVHTHRSVATVHTRHAAATVRTSHTAAIAHTHHGATTAPSHAPAHGSNATAAATAALTLHNLTEAVHLNAVVNLVEAIDPALGLKGKLAHAEGVFLARMKADLQPASPATIAAELHQGKVVLLLFLNPHAYDDDATAIGTTEVAYKLRHHVAAHLALADQVNSFGSITRDIQVYQTPTLLIVNPQREVTTVTGITDEFSLEQAIAEAKG